MTLRLRDISLSIHQDERCLIAKVASYLNLEPSALHEFKIVRRSLDARKKPDLRWVYTVEFAVSDESRLLQQKITKKGLQLADQPKPLSAPVVRAAYHVLVVGMGPAGLFAAKLLAEHGARVTIVERGRPVEKRVRDVERFWSSGELCMRSNVHFGEGGAGTFSDGKLTTRLNHPWRQYVLKTLVDFGAPDETLIEAKPHVGTDRLRRVLINFRQYLLNLGVELRYECCLTDLELTGNRVAGGVLNNHDLLGCDALLLAPGQSARDTYAMLHARRVQLEPKAFAIGVRVEHPADLINRIQYGSAAKHKLPTADYALRYNDPVSRRGAYSFCMCPGGEVINAASESDGLVVNGMSRMNRDGAFSNSALVVTVSPEDWDPDPLGGLRFQQHWEQRAFSSGGGRFIAPAQNLMTFMGKRSVRIGKTTCRPGVVEVDMNEVLPQYVSDTLRQALPTFDRQMRGFITNEATLIGVETRTSAPIRITRTDTGESVTHRGLFPAGEGAGYAGGIMSAALDGLGSAQHILEYANTGGFS
ncbi:MAG: FAD-binding protein [Deltaproteobacteria bacterium]|jgi:uncharacterized FAD-dependent dehydrogenase|nr:FAD-binding protein [Deltaproteobacteria bacterium]